MPYTKQLNLMIEKSGKSLKEIAYECKNYGVEITQSYIGILRNSIENKIPSEPVSRALAQVCGEKYIDLLVVEGGIDKCPEIIREKFEIMRSCYKKLLLKTGIPVENLPSDESINNIPYYKILDITVNSLSNNIDLIEDKETENLLIQETEYQVFDDNLEPEIKKGQKFKLLCIKLNRYQENDIL